MKNLLVYFTVILLVFFTACNKSAEKKFYTNGVLYEQREYNKKSDSTIYSCVYYYPNGQVRAIGVIKNGSRNGVWEEFYADGSEKWLGEYNNGKRKLIILSNYPQVVFKDSVLRINKINYLKVFLKGVHPDDIIIACDNGIITKADRKDLFDYMVTPNRKGAIKFFFFIMQEGKMVKIGVDDSLNVIE